MDVGLTSAAVVVIAVALPWWAMRTDSPVVTRWVPLTLGLWLLGLVAGLVCVPFGGRPRAVGLAIVLATAAGALLFVTLYMAAFALGDWGGE
jgi:hypothetical protein